LTCLLILATEKTGFSLAHHGYLVTASQKRLKNHETKCSVVELCHVCIGDVRFQRRGGDSQGSAELKLSDQSKQYLAQLIMSASFRE
jgi:hypothetical protein